MYSAQYTPFEIYKPVLLDIYLYQHKSTITFFTSLG